MNKCNLNSKRKPKDGDILVLANNRNIIYNYNANGKSYNAFHVSVYKGLKQNFIIYKLDDNSVVAYNAHYDFATQEEIEYFNNAISEYERTIRPDEHECNNIFNLANDFCDLICTKNNIDDPLLEDVMMDDVLKDLFVLRKSMIEKYKS